MKNKSDYLQQMQTSSVLSGANAAYIEDLYEQYLQDHTSVSTEWQHYFAELNGNGDVSHAAVRQRFLELGQQRQVLAISGNAVIERKQSAVIDLIHAYRRLGHLQANIDPLGLMQVPQIADLTLEFHGLGDADLELEFDADGAVNMRRASLRQIIDTLKQTYCGTIGAEIMHISNTEERRWLLQRFEKIKGKPDFSKNEQIRMLEKLAAVDGLEKYLSMKYVGQKRFSIEGADTLIPMMDALTYHGAKNGVKEIIVGMAHRGRLNMLVNFLGKSPAQLFDEFEGKIEDNRSGDVKYHKGFSSNVVTPEGAVHLAMAYNPSHLEAVNPVLEGSVRAKQWRRGDEQRQQVLPVLLHGDASFSSQGVVQETFNMSQVPAYTTGGTLHIVINNQIGFTTSAEEGRSTHYCTDIAKMVDAPIFHVNGDDPEACVFAIKLLYDYRKRFNKDVVIDLVCYRRHGHQEVDEPTMTQPLMYQVIKKHPTPFKFYATQLEKQKLINGDEIKQIVKTYRQALDSGEPVIHIDEDAKRGEAHKYAINWKAYDVTDWRTHVDTKVSKKGLQAVAQKIIDSLEGYKLQPQVAKLVANRKKMALGELPLDWGFAETLAYATLLLEQHPIRIAGEDVQRGTFGHRHAVLHNYETGETCMPLEHLSDEQAPIWIYNSILSEFATMGFEVGYAAAAPDTLVIWEAQYGDFANGAQVIIDQFLSSGEQKWGQKSGLVLFLPHGYEGSGPEHSSARLERYLQLCAQHNMQVCVPTTPAQVFHMLRRQMLRRMRIPLIVMTPKSILRSPLAVSPIEDFTQGQFEPVLGEIDGDIAAKKVKRVVICTGKIYYDLLRRRREEKVTDTALLRIEQLYPFPTEQLTKQLQLYGNATNIVWAQEEPRNQGTWYSMQHHMRAAINEKQLLSCVSRPASAAPAGGYMSTHLERQKRVVGEALNIKNQTK